MKILALEREAPITDAVANADKDSASSASILRAVAGRLWQLTQGSVVRESCFDAGRHTAVLVLECGDLAEALEARRLWPLVGHQSVQGP